MAESGASKKKKKRIPTNAVALKKKVLAQAISQKKILAGQKSSTPPITFLMVRP